VTALAVTSSVASQGATAVNSLVPVMDFMTTQILPELQTDTPVSPVLKADALKFVWTFRQQLSKNDYISLFPSLIKNIQFKDYVVHTYAATCLERLLSVKDRNGRVSTARLTKEDIQPYLSTLLSALFTALEAEQSKENEHLIKAVMRLCSTAQEGIIPYGPQCTTALINLFGKVYRNPVNATFNHYLFESLAIVCRIVTKNAEGKKPLEAQLFPIFTAILSEDIIEFEPYVFQILALLIEANENDISAEYFQLLPPLMLPVLWDRSSNIPPLVRLISAYIKKGAAQIVANNQLVGILGIFQKKLLNPKFDQEAFQLLTAVTTYIPPEPLNQYMRDVIIGIFTHFTTAKSTKGKVAYIIYAAKIINKNGPSFFIQQLEACQQGLFTMVMDKIWIMPDNLNGINEPYDRKTVALACTKLLIEPMLDNSPFWNRLLEAEIAILEFQGQGVEEDQETEEAPELGGATYTPLNYASKTESQDPYPGVEAKAYLASSVYQLLQQNPAKLNLLPNDARKCLGTYFDAANLPKPQTLA